MTSALYRVLIVACVVTLASQGDAAASIHQTARLVTADGKKPSSSPIHIPKLPAFGGVTLSGMDFESNSTSNSSDLLGHNPTKDAFTLPEFEQAMHYLEDREVSLIKLPLSWETLQQNVTKLEVYTDVVATVTSRNASAIVTLTISAAQFSNFTSNATLNKGAEVHHKDRDFVRDAASASFVELWGQLAKLFQDDRRVIFHLMAVPNGSILPRNWNQTIQAAVTTIRQEGASNVIVLPSYTAPNGTTYDSFRDFHEDFARMQNITNPDGSTNGIVFDLAQTVGPKGPTSQQCEGVDVPNIVDPVVKLLKEHDRQAILGTLAAGSDPSCTSTLVKFAQEVSNSYPALAGFVMLGAGAFDQSSPWALVKEVQPDSAHCSVESADDLVDQQNFGSVQPYFPKKAKNDPSQTKDE